MCIRDRDLTGQRLRKVVQLASVIELRLNNMVSLWDAEELDRYKKTENADNQEDHLKNGPALPPDAQKQNEIDVVLATNDVDDDSALDWSNTKDPTDPNNDEFFIIDDSFEEVPDPNMMAFEADTEDELAFQAPPAEEVMDDDDDWYPSEASTPEVSTEETLQSSDEEADIAPLHKRLAQFN